MIPVINILAFFSESQVFSAIIPVLNSTIFTVNSTFLALSGDDFILIEAVLAFYRTIAILRENLADPEEDVAISNENRAYQEENAAILNYNCTYSAEIAADSSLDGLT